MIDLTRFDAPLFSDGYRRLLAEAAGIAEPRPRYHHAAAPPTLRERVLRCVWFDQTLATDRLRGRPRQKRQEWRGRPPRRQPVPSSGIAERFALSMTLS